MSSRLNIKLSSEEKSVLSLIIKGYGNKEISSALKISLSETENIVNNILDKYNADTKIKAAVRAIKEGFTV